MLYLCVLMRLFADILDCVGMSVVYILCNKLSVVKRVELSAA